MQLVTRGQWTGRVFSTLTVLFLLMDSVMKILKAEVAVKGSANLGYPESVVFGLGVVLLLSTALYAIPRTSVVATHVRVGDHHRRGAGLRR